MVLCFGWRQPRITAPQLTATDGSFNVSGAAHRIRDDAVASDALLNGGSRKDNFHALMQ